MCLKSAQSGKSQVSYLECLNNLHFSLLLSLCLWLRKDVATEAIGGYILTTMIATLGWADTAEGGVERLRETWSLVTFLSRQIKPCLKPATSFHKNFSCLTALTRIRLCHLPQKQRKKEKKNEIVTSVDATQGTWSRWAERSRYQSREESHPGEGSNERNHANPQK